MDVRPENMIIYRPSNSCRPRVVIIDYTASRVVQMNTYGRASEAHSAVLKLLSCCGEHRADIEAWVQKDLSKGSKHKLVVSPPKHIIRRGLSNVA